MALQLISYDDYCSTRYITEADKLFQAAMLGWTPNCVMMDDFDPVNVLQWSEWLKENDVNFVFNRVSKTFVFENEADAVSLRLVKINGNDSSQ